MAFEHINVHDNRMESKNSTNDSKITAMMETAGYEQCTKIASTLQGSIWRSVQTSSGTKVVIKVTDRNLHKKQLVVVKGREIKVQENIKKESAILEYLAQDPLCPNSVIKRLSAFKSDYHYFLVMEDGGICLFDFVLRVHEFLSRGVLDITEWHKVVKMILSQMIECLEYIHSKNVCHFDVSLENILINDIDVNVDENNKITFCIEDEDCVQIKLCDFGLAEIYPSFNFESNKYCGKSNYQSPEISLKQMFSASSNDIWCLGTCLFMMIVGTAPWNKTKETDERFKYIMDNGDMITLLTAWNRAHYVDKYIVQLFSVLFQYEENRVSIDELKECSWLKRSNKREKLKCVVKRT